MEVPKTVITSWQRSFFSHQDGYLKPSHIHTHTNYIKILNKAIESASTNQNNQKVAKAKELNAAAAHSS